MYKNKHIFIAAAARFSDLLYLSLRNRKLEEEDAAHSLFGGYDRNKRVNNGNTNWNTQAMCVAKKPAEKLVAISIEGKVFTYAGGEKGLESITPEPYEIRGLASIEGFAYACGMDRQVFKRISEGKWVPLHAPDSSHIKETHGFEAIAGFSGKDLYAVGWRGEIWHYDGTIWRQIDSPSSEILTTVVCADDGYVYIGGRNGVIIRGHGNEWSIINQDGYQGDFWGMQWFNNKLYVATMERICVLKNNNIEPVEMGDDEPETCYHLTAAEGVMWSVGTDDIFSFDGKKWTRVE